MDKKAIGIIGILGAIAYGLLNVAYDLYMNPAEYSDRWFESLSDDELDAEREKTRIEFASAGRGDYHHGIELEARLNRFNKEWRKRNYTNPDKSWTRPPREHGYNLYKDDD